MTALRTLDFLTTVIACALSVPALVWFWIESR